jgi:hypothetical protein
LQIFEQQKDVAYGEHNQVRDEPTSTLDATESSTFPDLRYLLLCAERNKTYARQVEVTIAPLLLLVAA